MAYPRSTWKRRHYLCPSLTYHNPIPFRLWQIITRPMEGLRLTPSSLGRLPHRTCHLHILHTPGRPLADADLVR